MSTSTVLAPAVLTVPEVATYLKVSEAHVYRLIQRGEHNGGIPSRKVGRSLRVSRAWLDEWIANGPPLAGRSSEFDSPALIG